MHVSAIEIVGLEKRFGKTAALAGLDLTVAPGEVHGFLGPNGSGKTTTIRILLGLLRANAGSATVLGQDPWRDVESLHKRLAHVPGDVSLWPNLTGGEVIDMLARMRGDLDPHRRTELVERFDLDPKKKNRSYSKGNRQKVALVAALASRAELLLLDEPTSGLDPLMEVTFREVVHEMKSEGRTILLSSHILSEVEALSDRVSIIRAGRVVESGTLDDLRHLHATQITAELGSVPPALQRVAGVSGLVVRDNRVSFRVTSESLDDAMRVLTEGGIRALTSNPPSLEELFLAEYEHSPEAV